MSMQAEDKNLNSLSFDSEILNSQQLIDGLNSKAYEIRNKNTNESLATAEEALKLSKEISYTFGQAQALNNIGFIKTSGSDYESALKYFSEAYSLFIELDSEPGLASIYYNFGMTYIRLGEYTKALDYLFKSLAIREKIDDDRGIYNALFQIGYIHHQFKEYETAIELIERALKICRNINDQVGIAAQLMLLGMVLSDKGEPEKAIACLNECLEIRKSISDDRGYGTAMLITGDYYLKLSEYTNAQFYYSEGLKIAIKVNDITAQVRFYTSLAKLHFQKEEYDESRKYLQKSELLASTNKLNSLLPVIYSILGSINENEHNYKEALANFKKHQEYKTMVFSEESKLKLKHNEVIRKMEAASLEAEINRLKNVELREAYLEIETKNKEILDSITYAKRIQTALITNEKYIAKLLARYDLNNF